MSTDNTHRPPNHQHPNPSQQGAEPPEADCNQFAADGWTGLGAQGLEEVQGRRHSQGRLVCQVPGCNQSLVGAKPSFIRRCVCPQHAGAHSVNLHGVISRFCQQCTRFHDLRAFEGERRSCTVKLQQRCEAKRVRRMARRIDVPPRLMEGVAEAGMGLGPGDLEDDFGDPSFSGAGPCPMYMPEAHQVHRPRQPRRTSATSAAAGGCASSSTSMPLVASPQQALSVLGGGASGSEFGGGLPPPPPLQQQQQHPGAQLGMQAADQMTADSNQDAQQGAGSAGTGAEWNSNSGPLLGKRKGTDEASSWLAAELLGGSASPNLAGIVLGSGAAAAAGGGSTAGPGGLALGLPPDLAEAANSMAAAAAATNGLPSQFGRRSSGILQTVHALASQRSSCRPSIHDSIDDPWVAGGPSSAAVLLAAALDDAVSAAGGSNAGSIVNEARRSYPGGGGGGGGALPDGSAAAVAIKQEFLAAAGSGSLAPELFGLVGPAAGGAPRVGRAPVVSPSPVPPRGLGGAWPHSPAVAAAAVAQQQHGGGGKRHNSELMLQPSAHQQALLLAAYSSTLSDEPSRTASRLLWPHGLPMPPPGSAAASRPLSMLGLEGAAFSDMSLGHALEGQLAAKGMRPLGEASVVLDSAEVEPMYLDMLAFGSDASWVDAMGGVEPPPARSSLYGGATGGAAGAAVAVADCLASPPVLLNGGTARQSWSGQSAAAASAGGGALGLGLAVASRRPLGLGGVPAPVPEGAAVSSSLEGSSLSLASTVAADLARYAPYGEAASGLGGGGGGALGGQLGSSGYGPLRSAGVAGSLTRPFLTARRHSGTTPQTREPWTLEAAGAASEQHGHSAPLTFTKLGQNAMVAEPLLQLPPQQQHQHQHPHDPLLGVGLTLPPDPQARRVSRAGARRPAIAEYAMVSSNAPPWAAAAALQQQQEQQQQQQQLLMQQLAGDGAIGAQPGIVNALERLAFG